MPNDEFMKHSPSEKPVVIPPMQDAEIGALLTAQYHKACNAMPEVLRFGAMMIRLEDHCKAVHDGQLSKGGRGNTDGSVASWLEKHAPDVKRPTAYRFRDVTLSVAQDYRELVGAKIAKAFAISDLVTADPKALPEPARKKQQALFDYVAGTSQKSWLDKIRPAKQTGGKTYERDGTKGKREKLSTEGARALLREIVANTAQHVRFYHDKHAYVVVDNDAELDGLIDHFEEAAKATRAWRKMSKSDRAAAFLEQAKIALKEARE